MTLLVPLILFGWVPFTIFLFLYNKPHRAVLISVIGGVLFLPMTEYHIPGLPAYTKSAAIAIGLILGGRISGQRQAANFKWSCYDLPMLIWSFCPIATSLSNDLGLYDGMAGAWVNIATWGIPYLAGRIYFDSTIKLRDLCLALVIGGLLYLPLCLYEIRMSPQLNNMVYGFFPHDWAQHLRYGGFRPIVFMQHGLMVALWMAITTTAAFWLWRSDEIKSFRSVPMSMLVFFLALTTILCKSGNGWIILGLGCGGYLMYRWTQSITPFRLVLLLVPCYIMLRISGLVESARITAAASHFFDLERINSLGIRLLQEDLFVEKALLRPLFGWGGYNRGWPVDPATGEMMVRMIDALWLITFSSRGFIGIVSLGATMSIGPWLALRSFQNQKLSTDFSQLGPVLLCFIVIHFLIDSLVNGMINPVYIVISGSLVGCYSTLTISAKVN